MRLSCCAKHGKVENKRNDLRSAIKRAGEQVADFRGVSDLTEICGTPDSLVLGKRSRVSVSDEPLRENTDYHRGIDRGVDSDRLRPKKTLATSFLSVNQAATRHVAAVLHDNVRMYVVEPELGELSVEKINWNRKKTSNPQSRWDHLIRLARRKHLLSQGAIGDGVTVVRLSVLATP
jgi:hypothetical protein